VIYIYEVHMSPGGKGNQHIAAVRWKNPDSGKSGESKQHVMVDWIANQNGSAYVCGKGGHLARVGVVRKADPPYIRTYADGVWSDNLLALNRY
jgi:hypothetical protein